MKGASHTHTNRLAHETSPYLLQHAHNPVDWFAWGAEALERSKREDKPILLSIGYAACHWCHVMERESFENEDVARVMNEHFVCIKVDREERPDIDDIYMTATVAMTGHGGWPMTVFLTPKQEPFYAGTYFPPDDRQGRPGFKTLLERIAELWSTSAGGASFSGKLRWEKRRFSPPPPSSQIRSIRCTGGSARRRSFRLRPRFRCSFACTAAPSNRACCRWRR